MNDPFKVMPQLLLSYFSNSDFGLGTFLPHLFCTVASWTLTLTEPSEACTLDDGFCDLLDSFFDVLLE